jgi:hypothetical protein
MSKGPDTYVWIDTTSGTWGLTDDSNGQLVLCEYGTDVLDFLDQASDSEIADYGNTYGKRAVPVGSPAIDTVKGI